MIDNEQRKTLKPVPTVFPTQEEFDNPIVYLSSPEIQKLGDKYGMIKVKPPSSWKPPFSIDQSSFRFKPRVQKLSDLSLLIRIRTIFKDGLVNFMKMKKKKIPRTLYFLLSNKEKMYYYDLFLKINQYIAGNFQEIDTKRKKNDTNGRNTVYNEIRNFPEIWQRLNKEAGLGPHSEEIENFYYNYMKEYCIFLAKKYSTKIASFESEYQFNQNPYNDDSNESDQEHSDEEEEDYWCHACGGESDDAKILLCDGCNDGYHIYCLKPQLKSVPRGSWYCDECLVGSGEFGFVTSNTSYSLEEFQRLNTEFKEKYFANILANNDSYFSLSRLEDLSRTYLDNDANEDKYVDFLENEFWENLVNNEQSNMKVNYGADIHNLRPGQISGFPMNYPFREELSEDYYMNHPFNLTKLPFAEGSLLNHLNDKISGMTIPWLYIGSLFSTFCWHLEDHYMLSANYCHYGDIKKWYCIPESSCNRFEVLMKELAPDLFLRQPDLLHQLVTLLSPYDIVKNEVECYYANQRAGEFIITFPKCYHSGFNCGFNVNEAVNFSNNGWLKFGINALDNYKLVQKPPVFNQIHLSYSILYHFLHEADESGEKFIRDNKITESNYNLIIMCIAYLEKNASDYVRNFKSLSESLPKYKKLQLKFAHDYYDSGALSNSSFNIKNAKNLDQFYNESANKEGGSKMMAAMNGSMSEDIMCANCREICCMAYVEVYDKKYTTYPSTGQAVFVDEQEETKVHLATPEPSPINDNRAIELDDSGSPKRKRGRPCKKRRKVQTNESTFVKQNVRYYCIEHFHKSHEKLRRDFTVWVKCDDTKVNNITSQSKLKLKELKICD
ncbi:histone demethylase [Saccharomycopsis crataegensis]|uniref:Histone demethylase n=1 Tax=Saccharomycopsis crataegensis TaxID=43959 RepID=A0AAV5QS47_9ASCO|nr:histone demethylase [Saccharomycopsis crataegensis]